eukprot:evm.model.scf_2338.3 EVM.evm.TU.scf_2338.3   scf_2338:19969-23204(+)
MARLGWRVQDALPPSLTDWGRPPAPFHRVDLDIHCGCPPPGRRRQRAETWRWLRRPLLVAHPGVGTVCRCQESDDETVAELVEQADVASEKLRYVLLHDSWEALLGCLPDSAVDRFLFEMDNVQRPREQGKEVPEARWAQLERLAKVTSKEEFYMDACGTRTLTLNNLNNLQVLSSMLASSTSFVQRWHAKCCLGEEVILTVQLDREETAEPQYRGIRLSKRWVLRRITGEPVVPDPLPSAPSSSWAPELVVMAQLEGLKYENAERVFAFASTANQAATGPVERFSQMLRAPPYAPLLGHSQSEILNAVLMGPAKKFFMLVAVHTQEAGTPGLQRHLYLWITVRESSAGFENCWRTESVQPVNLSMLGTWGREGENLV